MHAHIVLGHMATSSCISFLSFSETMHSHAVSERNDTALSALSNESAVSLLTQYDSNDKREQIYKQHNIYL